MTLSRWATPYVVQPYQARAGHAVVELAVDRFPDVAVELVDCFALRVDAETERAGRKSAVQLVVGYFEYDLCPGHWSLRSPLLLPCRFEGNRQSPELAPCWPIRRTDFLPAGVTSRVCKAATRVGKEILGCRTLDLLGAHRLHTARHADPRGLGRRRSSHQARVIAFIGPLLTRGLDAATAAACRLDCAISVLRRLPV